MPLWSMINYGPVMVKVSHCEHSTPLQAPAFCIDSVLRVGVGDPEEPVAVNPTVGVLHSCAFWRQRQR
jgi:hypothetical protein